jgi:hypothetical protein
MGSSRDANRWKRKVASAGGPAGGVDDPRAERQGPEGDLLEAWARQTARVKPTRRSDWHLIAPRIEGAACQPRERRVKSLTGPIRLPAAAVLALALLILVNGDFARAADASWRAVTTLATSLAWSASERLEGWLVADPVKTAIEPTSTPAQTRSDTVTSTSSPTPTPTSALTGNEAKATSTQRSRAEDSAREVGPPGAPANATPAGAGGPTGASTATDAPPARGDDTGVQPTPQPSPERHRPRPSAEPTHRPPGDRRVRPHPTRIAPEPPHPPRPTREAPPHPTRDDRRRPTRFAPTAVPPTEVPEPTESGPADGGPPPPPTATPAVQSSRAASA